MVLEDGDRLKLPDPELVDAVKTPKLLDPRSKLKSLAALLQRIRRTAPALAVLLHPSPRTGTAPLLHPSPRTPPPRRRKGPADPLFLRLHLGKVLLLLVPAAAPLLQPHLRVEVEH